MNARQLARADWLQQRAENAADREQEQRRSEAEQIKKRSVLTALLDAPNPLDRERAYVLISKMDAEAAVAAIPIHHSRDRAFAIRRLNEINAELSELNARKKAANRERTEAEREVFDRTFRGVAQRMLPPEVFAAIQEESCRLMGRGRGTP